MVEMHASWEKNVAQYRGADLRQAVRMATVMENVAAAYCDLLKVVPLANRKSHGDLRACVREWTLAQRCFDDRGQHMALDLSAQVDIGQVPGAKERGKKWKGEEKGKGMQGNGDVKEKAWTDDFYSVGKCGYCGKCGHKEAWCTKLKRDQEANRRLRQLKRLQQWVKSTP